MPTWTFSFDSPRHGGDDLNFEDSWQTSEVVLRKTFSRGRILLKVCSALQPGFVRFVFGISSIWNCIYDGKYKHVNGICRCLLLVCNVSDPTSTYRLNKKVVSSGRLVQVVLCAQLTITGNLPVMLMGSFCSKCLHTNL